MSVFKLSIEKLENALTEPKETPDVSHTKHDNLKRYPLPNNSSLEYRKALQL